VNQTLLHLALRQDEAKQQRWRRMERWLVYLMSVGFVAGMALFLTAMIYFHRHRPEKMVTGWDYALPIVGAAAALLAGGVMYLGHRAQARREQRFGESLRDQLNRGIAQLNDLATTARMTLVVVLVGGICPIALYLLIGRINGKSIGDDGFMTVTMLLPCIFGVATGIWSLRQQRRDVVLPHKRRLETLLKELDGQ
jgi:cytochrome c biogenesis protein CcdA